MAAPALADSFRSHSTTFRRHNEGKVNRPGLNCPALFLRDRVGRFAEAGGRRAVASVMIYWVHIARAIDRATLHRERCSEVPSNVSSSDYWTGGWFDYPDKDRALAAMEQAGTTEQRRCPLCKP